MALDWDPLSVREGFADRPCLREGVPASLEPRLRRWISTATLNRDEVVDRLMLRFDLVVSPQRVQAYQRAYNRYKKKYTEATAKRDLNTALLLPATLPGVSFPRSAASQFLAYDTPCDLLLDLIDDLLKLILFVPPTPAKADLVTRFIRGAKRTFVGTDPRGLLQGLLDDAQSAYTIREDGQGLERRVNVATTVAVAQATLIADQQAYPTAAARLRSAWTHTYSLHSNPGMAYAEAVRAVEAVAVPLFLPADPSPTLGKVRSHLAEGGTQYELAILDQSSTPASIDTVRSMIETLWFGHRDRHEGGPTSAPITQGAAEAAVSIATTLVQLLATGAVQRKL